MLKFHPQFIYWIRACITTSKFSVKVNGSLCGYFAGAKGLRQGDPLSPYLFVIAMEVLSTIISRNTKSADFEYHWKTKQLKLTHLCFADDLILFCRGDLKSVSILKESLDQFTILSGLSLNVDKSFCYLSNVPPAIADEIVTLLGFQLGSFPAKFLGVPLITTKLSLADCQPLLHKVRVRLGSWTNRFLSYAGRILLIKSVIFAIQAYWSSFFILPSSVIRDLQSIMTRFLWKGPLLQKSGARVAWSKITLPLQEGGLAIKDLVDWNKSLIILQLLKVVNSANNSLWAAWVRTFYLKNRFFWTTPIPNDCSWTWRKVLSLRTLARQFLTYKVGNGCSFDLWFDPWLDSTPIANDQRHNLIRNSGIPFNAKVSCIINWDHWSLPESNHTDVLDFRASFNYATPLNPHTQDQILWGHTEISMVKGKEVWEAIRKRGSMVDWHTLVWNRCIPPRFATLLWLAFRNSFRTKDRLLSYGLDVDPACNLCNTATESFGHLFFHCRVSFQILVSVLRHCGWRGMSRNWATIASFITSRTDKHPKYNLLCLGFAMVVYYVWQERNKRLFEGASTPIRLIVKNILQILKSRITSVNRLKCYLTGCSHLRHLAM